MTEMVERVARASEVAGEEWERQLGDRDIMAGLPDDMMPKDRFQACAAIKAMRLGKRGQISVEQAGGDKLRQFHEDDEKHYPVETACAVFDAMIDAALAQKVDTSEKPQRMVNANMADTRPSVSLTDKVEVLGLPVRALTCFKWEGIVTVGDLVECSKVDMMGIPNFGRATLNRTIEALADVGLAFALHLDTPR